MIYKNIFAKHGQIMIHELCFSMLLLMERCGTPKILKPSRMLCLPLPCLPRAEVSRSLEEPTAERIEEIFAESADA